MPRLNPKLKEKVKGEKINLDDFPYVDDLKVRTTLIGMADKYDAHARAMILKTYNDPILASTYKGIRDSGIYQHGGKGGARHRKIVEFPNFYVYEFVDTVMKAIYGYDWLKNNKALRHELVKPWHVVKTL